MARELPPGYSEVAPSRELPEGYSLAYEIRDAPADFQPSGQEPPSNPSFEVAGRSQPVMGATPSYAPPDTTSDSGISPTRALLTNEPTSGFAEDVIRGIPATVGGMAGAVSGAGLASIPLAGLGGAAGESARQGVAQAYAGLTGREFTPPGQVLKNVGIQAAMQGGGQAVGLGIGAAAKGGGRVLSQVARAASGTPEKSSMAVLRDPGLIGRALPVDEAGAQYAASTGGLKSGVEASREVFGKSHFSGEAIADKFDELLPSLQNGSMDAQTALALRQRTMKALNDLPFNQKELGRLLAQNIEQLDTFLEPKLPSWGAGRTGYRESKIAEDFSSWLPLNKNLSPNVLRTGAALATAAKSASEGKLVGLAALPFVSPKVWGVGLRGVGYAAKAAGAVPPTVYRVGTQAGAGAGGSALADAYMRQQVAR